MNTVWQKILNFFTTYGWKIVTVILVIIAGIFLIKLLNRLVRKLFKRRHIDDIVSYFVTSVINIVMIIVLIVAVFDIIGISTAPFVAVLGTVGLALALSLQDSLSNIASGVVIIVTKPFRKGDYIASGNIEGSVDKITMLTTHLITADNKKVIIPNNKVAKTEITNFSILDLRRVDLKCNIEFDADIPKVRKIIEEILNKHEMIIKTPEPTVKLVEVTDNSLIFNIRVWVKTPDYWTVSYDLRESIYIMLKEKGYNIPYQKLNVKLVENK